MEVIQMQYPLLISTLALTIVLSGCTEPLGQNKILPTDTEQVSHLTPYKQGDDIPAMAYIEHQEVYNPESVIPPQCYTKTDGVNNPCYACHQSYHDDKTRPNVMKDGDLQGDYAFSDLGLKNHWKNLFIDRTDLIKGISDQEITNWIEQDNYTPFITKMIKRSDWRGEVTPLKNLAFPEKAFDELGFARDGSGWVAFNYKPFPSTFWPTNGSTGDVMIRLPRGFQTKDGLYSRDAYLANLSLTELAVKGLDAISVPRISEQVIGRDLNGDGKLSDITRIVKQAHYVGDAEIGLAHMLYPEGTEFLHTVRYLGVDEHGKIYNAPRLKELRYMRKHNFKSKREIAGSYYREAKEKEFEKLPVTLYIGDKGVNNTFGWTINGYIEDSRGELRPQHAQELAFCNGCHKTVGATYDQTFSFARKVEGAAGWGYINLKTQKDVPNVGEEHGEFLTYMSRVGGGDEFRQNQEMLKKWFTGGKVDMHKVQKAVNLYELITPSKERALALNKAYLTIVREQSYLFGRDATLVKAKNVLENVDDSQAPLQQDKQFKWDMQLDWSKN
ncbi:hypothetical protein N476_25755 [Pseudoalteromonas luteoviolacea H33]|uniref:Uncharacterized protein n=2 Tax=Pseudoalteromonas luteoviolacea TaxID=43657 RepID=A0A167A791_9GAMM|nr:hypothetical protein [Pseudoalteromonas luteoviolacea]KZN45061.1 hypothetical protein N476_25755 [Pseudoalteromonas luteoviolacea H33]KZN79265.1 hypothetical protein N477_00260 [Pseudoalteromonas luteoviolacea H33-S]